MKRLHVIGRKGHGKTTLVVDLVREFCGRGLRVGTIKHTHHRHELDTPGKDSHQHRLAGAELVGVLSRSMNAVFWPASGEEDSGAGYASFEPMFAHCDLVLVEGDTQAAAPKIEVWRAAVGTPPFAREDREIRALVTDDPVDVEVPVLPRKDVPAVAEWILDSFR